jgi:hypothetical protein
MIRGVDHVAGLVRSIAGTPPLCTELLGFPADPPLELRRRIAPEGGA